jgi:hypothetical protein
MQDHTDRAYERITVILPTTTVTVLTGSRPKGTAALLLTAPPMLRQDAQVAKPP